MRKSAIILGITLGLSTSSSAFAQDAPEYEISFSRRNRI